MAVQRPIVVVTANRRPETDDQWEPYIQLFPHTISVQVLGKRIEVLTASFILRNNSRGVSNSYWPDFLLRQTSERNNLRPITIVYNGSDHYWSTFRARSWDAKAPGKIPVKQVQLKKAK
jgi:hypothetical protein